MKHTLYAIFLLLSIHSCYAQQTARTAHCQNVEFDKKVESLIRFSVPVLSPEQVMEMKDAVIFDAREIEEYNISHIPGAHYLGYEDFEAYRLQETPKDAPIVLYCSVGYRSEKIGEKLQKLGYTNVYNLYGSIFEWVNQGYEIQDADNNKTNKVHTYNKKWSKWVEEGKAEKVY